MNILPLDHNRICPQCGFTRSQTNAPQMRYCRGLVTDERYKREPCKLSVEPPHQHRRCPRCKYEWLEWPASEDTLKPWVDAALAEFSERYQCLACGFVGGDMVVVQATYCPGAVVEEQYQRRYCSWEVEQAHLHMVCPLCSYEWPVAALSQPLAIGVAEEQRG